MAFDPADLPADVLTFLTERHLAMLTTTRPDGSLHTCAVGFTFNVSTQRVRVITWMTSQKARNAARGGRASVGQVDGRRWLSFEGPVQLATDTTSVTEAVAAYTERYRPPKARTDRVVIEIQVEHVLGHV